MRFPGDIRIDTPQKVGLTVIGATTLALSISLCLAALSHWFYGPATLTSLYLIALLVPLLVVPPIVYWIAAISCQLYQQQAELWRLVQTDDLTGLLNRRAFFERGHQVMTTTKNGIAPQAALLLLDADEFKQINDTLGHVAGDEALRHLASTIRICADPTDIVARFGGDEFAVLRPNATSTELAQLADRIGERLAERPYHYGKESRLLRMSAGIADTDTIASFDALLLAADLALYEAKERNLGEFPTMHLPVQIYAAFSVTS